MDFLSFTLNDKKSNNFLHYKLVKKNNTYLADDKIDLGNIILQKALTLKDPINLPLYFGAGLMLEFFLSFIIIFFKNALKNK